LGSAGMATEGAIAAAAGSCAVLETDRGWVAARLMLVTGTAAFPERALVIGVEIGFVIGSETIEFEVAELSELIDEETEGLLDVELSCAAGLATAAAGLSCAAGLATAAAGLLTAALTSTAGLALLTVALTSTAGLALLAATLTSTAAAELLAVASATCAPAGVSPSARATPVRPTAMPVTSAATARKRKKPNAKRSVFFDSTIDSDTDGFTCP